MRIVIADDDMLVSGALRTILEKDQDIEVQGIASNGKEAIELYRKYEPAADGYPYESNERSGGIGRDFKRKTRGKDIAPYNIF